MLAGERESRDLSLHERYSLARRNTGHPAIITAVAVYPGPSSLPSRSFLDRRIQELQQHFPVLYTVIIGHRTTKPRAVLRAQPWSTADILSEAPYVASPDGRQFESLIDSEATRACQLDFPSGPGWQVRRHVRSTEPEGGRAYITLSLDHIHADGMGLKGLFEALLMDDISSLPYESLSQVSKMEEHVSVKPTLSFMLPIVFHKLLLPHLPHFVQSYFRDVPAWPANNLHAPLVPAPPGYSVFAVDAQEVASLKATSKEHGVKTLHALFKGIIAVAIWARFRHTLEREFLMTAATPRSERKATLGHPLCTGNYVSSHKVELRPKPSDDFWTIARGISDELTSPQAIQYGRMSMGMLAYVPDGIFDQDDPLRPTKWEDFFLTEANTKRPFEASVSVSNLGLSRLPPGAVDMLWGQNASPYSAAFNIGMIGHEGGIRLFIAWKDGAAVRRQDVEAVEKTMRQMVDRLITPHDTSTLQSLAL
ncbi:hypothetical protein IAU60_003589 [Kwoniella sp. DSM 27419]